MKMLRNLFLFVLGLFVAAVFTYGIAKTRVQLPEISDLRGASSISSTLGYYESTAVRRSRQSVVRVMSAHDEGLASSSGTYFEIKGKHYIITVSHGILGPCERTYIIYEDINISKCRNIVARDSEIDYAVFEIDKPKDIKPIKINNIPIGQKWKQSFAAFSPLYYTGFPNSAGPLTFGGRVAGYARGDYVYMHSYAWSGASGAGVFDYEGNYVGLVLAIDVGKTMYGIQAIEDMVVVVPSFKINWKEIK